MKSSDNVLALLIVALVAIIGIVVMLFAPAIVNNFSDAVGFTAHSVYPSFAAPESRLTINGNTLSVSDYAIYKTGYYSINGGAWQNFTLSGTALSGNWLTNTATYNLPSFPTGESYVVIYSCSKTNSVWDCHDNKWQLQIINLGSIAAPSINFIPPTPNNGATINTSSQEITANITDDSNTISSWIDFDKSLFGYWSMDYYNASGINDESSYNNFAVFNGGININNVVTGVRGNALNFDGIDDNINAGTTTSLNNIGCYNTISLWLKPAKLYDYEMYISKFYDAGPYGYGFDFGLMSDGKAVIMYRDATAISDGYTNSAIFLTNTWTNLVVVQNGANNVDIYANGQFLEKMVDLPCMVNRNIDALTIGSRGNELYFNGTIDEVMIFNRSLSSSEAKALYDSKTNKFNATISNLSNGRHNYSVSAIDGDGNLASSDKRTLNVNAVVTCTNACSANKCYSSTTYQTCSDTNGDDCNELSSYITCPNLGTCSGAGICTITSTPSCYDGIQNQGETGTDCGGPCSACRTSTGPIYYISTSGSDSSGNGTSNKPWKTLAYACSRVTTSGSVIHVNAGTYIETSQCNLAVGVSIEGEGVTSIIKSHVSSSYTYTIQLYSNTQGTNGNQHISNIKMDGDNLTGWGAMSITMRSNVEIYNCTFVDFYSRAVYFVVVPGTMPTSWSTGNKFHDNIVTDSTSCIPPDAGDGTTGELVLGGQQTMLIYNNIFDATERPSGSTGFLIKGVDGYNKDIKIYNNTLLKTPFGGTVWDFVIELWNCLGGIEIYNNTMTGSIDFSGTYGTTKGAYSYGAWIHNNIIGETTVSNQNARMTRGVQFEQQAEGIIVENNWFKNMGSAIYFPVYHESPFTFSTYTDINIRYNIFNNLGAADGIGGTVGYGIYFNTATGGINVCNGFHVYNNVFIGHVGTTNTGWGIEIPDNFATTTDVSIRNNIVENFDQYPVYGSTAVSGLSIEKNIFYGNGNSNAPAYSGSGTVQNNIISNPLFVSSTNFHLQSNSPAINAGINAGLTSDYDGNSVPYPAGGAPDIGAYEYHP